MTITLITPTADQPLGIALCESFMARQTVAFDQWIVADDGLVPATLSMGQQHLVARRKHEGAQSLANNMLRAVQHAKGDVIVIIEHDDWYAPNHIEICLDQLQGAALTGCRWQRYYNVANRHFRVMRNIGSSLCNTAFRRELLPVMEAAAGRAFLRNRIGLDRIFWDMAGGRVHEINTLVGIKGLPGRQGLGLGHKPPDAKWKHDPNLQQLKAWIGHEAGLYRKYGTQHPTNHPEVA